VNLTKNRNLKSYRNRAVYPNVALLGIPSSDKLTWGKINRALHQFERQRTSLDGIELIVRWLAFVWGAGRAGNPLLEGYGIPSSAMLEVIFSALGHDLTPGLESRSSCPEAIWQAVKWWHNYYDQEGRNQPRCIHRVEDQLIPAIREQSRGFERPTSVPSASISVKPRSGSQKIIASTRRRPRRAG